MDKVFRTYVKGRVLYVGDSLEVAIRTWDRETYQLGKSVPGGVSVQEFSDGVMMRDGWIFHVHDDGTVYVNPNLKG